MIAEDLGLGRLLELSKHSEGQGSLLRIGGVPVEVREVITASTISDVGKDHVFKNMCHLPRIMVERGYTSLFVITKHLVRLGSVLGGLEASLQVVVAGNLALQEHGHLLHQRIIRNREAREQVRFSRTQLGKATVPIGTIVNGWAIT